MGTTIEYKFCFEPDEELTKEQYEALIKVLEEEIGCDYLETNEFEDGMIEATISSSWSFDIRAFLEKEGIKGEFTIQKWFLDRDPDEEIPYKQTGGDKDE